MALNTDRRGHRYPAFTYEVSRAKVAEYAAVTGCAEPAHTADPRTVPNADVPVPPTFAAVLTLGLEHSLLADDALGAHWNLLHAGQRFSFSRPFAVGDVLRCTPHIADIVARRGLDLLTLGVDVDDVDGQPVCEARSLILFYDREAG